MNCYTKMKMSSTYQHENVLLGARHAFPIASLLKVSTLRHSRRPNALRARRNRYADCHPTIRAAPLVASIVRGSPDPRLSPRALPVAVANGGSCS